MARNNPRPTVIQQIGPPTDAEAAVLVRLLAEQDAVFHPPRGCGVFEWPWSNWWSLRGSYHVTGMPWRSRGSSDATVKEAERSLRALVSRRLVRVGRGETRTKSVVLTKAGDAMARHLAGVMGDYNAWQDLRKLARSERHLDFAYEDGWIAETALCGGRGWGADDRQALNEADRAMVVPSLAGWVELGMTTEGKCFYRLTEMGRQVADRRHGNWCLEGSAGMPDDDDRWTDLYWGSLRSAFKALEGNTTAGREIGCGLISAGLATLRELGEMRSKQGITV